ncbi:MAG: hypothetical protein EOO56_23500 [Hymenobacter sp.]|nr:MAG: hypothetical protein EOO56_23500 [Hymenobacter sp.]
MKNLLRSLLLPLFLGLLASCSVYENMVHPRRLPTPDMSAQAKAKFKAAEKARHKGMVLKSEDTPTSATDPSAPAGTEAKKDNKLSYNELPEGTKLKYDKEGLIKNKPNLKRLQYHRYDTRPLTPNDVNRENRKLRKHPKGKGNSKDDGNLAPQKREVTPVDDSPAPTAEPKPEKVEKVKEPKEKKSKKAPVPKPDPTVDPAGN